MKLMQHRYPTIRRLEIELRQLESAAPPTRPCKTLKHKVKLNVFLKISSFDFMLSFSVS